MSDMDVHMVPRSYAWSWCPPLLAVSWREIREILVVLKALLNERHGEQHKEQLGEVGRPPQLRLLRQVQLR